MVYPHAYEKIPPRLNDLLSLTPDGTDKRTRTAYYYSNNIITKFAVDLTDAPIITNPTDHGITWMDVDTLTMTVSSAPIADFPNDRMSSWTAEERLFCTYMHEFRHVVRKGLRKRLLRPDWKVPDDPHFADEHMPAFERELYARFEYSIFHPNISTPRATWLQNYIDFFGQASKYNGNGQAYCEMIYIRVINDINKLSKGFYFNKYPKISPDIVQTVKNNYRTLFQSRNIFLLVP